MNIVGLTTLTVVITIAYILIFLIFREYICWYWKINERVECLDEIRLLLKDISKKMGTTDDNIIEEDKYCPSCSKQYNPSDYREDAEEIFCSYCNTQLEK